MNTVRVAVIGSREFTDYERAKRALDPLIGWIESKHPGVPLVIVSGGAKGADTLAKMYADDHGIPIDVVYARWTIYGKRGADGAGLLRNTMMAAIVHYCIAFHKNNSSGTADMIDKCRANKVLVRVLKV